VYDRRQDPEDGIQKSAHSAAGYDATGGSDAPQPCHRRARPDRRAGPGVPARLGAAHRGGFYEFRREITTLARADQSNLLEVTVREHASNQSVNRAERDGDFWVLGGIYRPVRLEAVPQTYIERVAIDARADGAFSAVVQLDGVLPAGGSCEPPKTHSAERTSSIICQGG
jgi:hypothetical protein